MSWSVTLAGQTFTNTNVDGNAYADEATGLPAILGAVAAEADSLKGRVTQSTTAVTPGTGTKVFTITEGLAWPDGTVLVAESVGDPSHWVVGTSTLSGTTLTLSVPAGFSSGATARSDWLIRIPPSSPISSPLTTVGAAIDPTAGVNRAIVELRGDAARFGALRGSGGPVRTGIYVGDQHSPVILTELGSTDKTIYGGTRFTAGSTSAITDWGSKTTPVYVNPMDSDYHLVTLGASIEIRLTSSWRTGGNLLVRPEELNLSPWQVSGSVTRTADVSAPPYATGALKKGSNADRLQMTAATDRVYQTFNGYQDEYYTASFYAIATSGTQYVRAQFGNGVTDDLSADVELSSSAWKRVFVTSQAQATGLLSGAVRGYSGGATDIAVWGFMVNEGQAPLPYVPGTIFEPTNWSLASWTSSGSPTVGATAGLDPAGTYNATRVQFPSSAAAARVQEVVLTPGTTYTVSFWAKSHTGAGDQVVRPFANTGLVDSYGTDVTVSEGTWTLLSHSFTAVAAGSTVTQRVGCANNSSGTATDVLVWGARIDEGSTPVPFDGRFEAISKTFWIVAGAGYSPTFYVDGSTAKVKWLTTEPDWASLATGTVVAVRAEIDQDAYLYLRSETDVRA